MVVNRGCRFRSLIRVEASACSVVLCTGYSDVYEGGALGSCWEEIVETVDSVDRVVDDNDRTEVAADAEADDVDMVNVWCLRKGETQGSGVQKTYSHITLGQTLIPAGDVSVFHDGGRGADGGTGHGRGRHSRSDPINVSLTGRKRLGSSSGISASSRQCLPRRKLGLSFRFNLLGILGVAELLRRLQQ